MEKFWKYRFADVGKSELGKKHAQNIRSTVHRTGDLINIKLYSQVVRFVRHRPGNGSGLFLRSRVRTARGNISVIWCRTLMQKIIYICQTLHGPMKTRSSVIAEGSCDALYQLNSFQLLHSWTKKNHKFEKAWSRRMTFNDTRVHVPCRRAVNPWTRLWSREIKSCSNQVWRKLLSNRGKGGFSEVYECDITCVTILQFIFFWLWYMYCIVSPHYVFSHVRSHHLRAIRRRGVLL